MRKYKENSWLNELVDSWMNVSAASEMKWKFYKQEIFVCLCIFIYCTLILFISNNSFFINLYLYDNYRNILYSLFQFPAYKRALNTFVAVTMT